jgi:DNA-binding Xre family transcriptional regulator
VIELRIGEVAAQKGINAKTLSEEADISYNTALGLMRGVVTRLDLAVFDRVCGVLGTEPGELLRRVSDENDGGNG